MGFAVLTQALRSGYRVRASVRHAGQIADIQSHALIKPFVDQGHLDFVLVPDITAEGAFDAVLKDVVGILHIASPYPRPVGSLPSAA